jgi:hypothetical protein
MRSVLVTLLLATTAFAQVDCSNPDNLCTGDPCTIAAIAVESPCVVDFGSRALVVAGTLRVQSALGVGSISFTAASIAVPGMIQADDDGVPVHTDGGDITLMADADITVDGRLQSKGYYDGGTIVLDGGGDIRVRGPISATGRYSGGGHVAIDAVGEVEITQVVRVNGGGGTIGITAGGDLVVDGPLNGRQPAPLFGKSTNITLVAGGSILVADRIDASGTTFGSGDGDIIIRGAAGVTVCRPIRTRGYAIGGGVEVSSSAGNVIVSNSIDAGGRNRGNVIRLEAAGMLSVTGSLLARGVGVFGGDIFARGATVSLTAPRFDVRGGNDSTGGTIEGTATGNLTASGSFRAQPNGCIALNAGGMLDTSLATFAPPPVADCPGSPSGAFLD